MRVRAGAALVTLGLVTACGSQVSPQAFYAAQLGSSPAGSGSAANPGFAASGSTSVPGASADATVSRSAGAGGHQPGSGAFGSTPTGTTSSTASHGTPTRSASHSAATSSTPAQAACAPPTSSTPTVVVCPGTGLRDGQTVHVYASGFQNAKPTVLTAALVVTECADKGNNTQQGDCGALHFVNPDASGRVSLTITVVKVVGSNKNVCGATYKCLISVAQPKQPPDYEADQHINFA